MKSALIFVIVSLCVFSQSHAELTSCSEFACTDGNNIQNEPATLNNPDATSYSTDENPVIACCAMPCGQENVWDSAAYAEANANFNYDTSFGYVDTMPASGTVENGYFYYQVDQVCHRILTSDLSTLKTALLNEESGVDQNCASTFTTFEYDTDKSIAVEKLPAIKTALELGLWSECNLDN